MATYGFPVHWKPFSVVSFAVHLLLLFLSFHCLLFQIYVTVGVVDTHTHIYSVEFTVGSKPVKNFRMIERHYFRDRLLKNFDFEFGYCIPHSKNTCEHVYEFPKLPDELGMLDASIYSMDLVEWTFQNQRLFFLLCRRKSFVIDMISILFHFFLPFKPPPSPPLFVGCLFLFHRIQWMK